MIAQRLPHVAARVTESVESIYRSIGSVDILFLIGVYRRIIHPVAQKDNKKLASYTSERGDTIRYPIHTHKRISHDRA
jgi:hypothetical protein